MAAVDCPFVVHLYCSFQSRDNLYLLMEYVPGGDCYSLLQVRLLLLHGHVMRARSGGLLLAVAGTPMVVAWSRDESTFWGIVTRRCRYTYGCCLIT